MKAKHFFLVFLAISSFLTQSCIDKQKQYNNEKKMIQIVFNPEVSSKYEYTICNRRHIYHKIGEGNLNSDLYDSTGFALHVLKNPDGKFESKVIFSHHDVISRTNQNEQETEDTPNAFSKTLNVFKGLPLDVIYNSQGKITYLHGYDKFKIESDSMFLTYSDKNTKQRLPSDTVFTENYFKTLLEKPTHLISEQMIDFDKPWKSSDKMLLLGEEMPIEIENKVTNYRNGVLYVETNGIIDKKLEFRSNKFIQVKGTQEGKLEIEAATGMLLKKDVNIRLSGKVKIGPIEQVIAVEDSATISGVRK